MSALALALRFALEVAGVAAIAWVGFHAADGLLGWVLAVGAPIVLIVAWALLVAPGARNPISQDLRVLLGSGLLLVAAALLALSGQPIAATVFTILVVVDTVLLFALAT